MNRGFDSKHAYYVPRFASQDTLYKSLKAYCSQYASLRVGETSAVVLGFLGDSEQNGFFTLYSRADDSLSSRSELYYYVYFHSRIPSSWLYTPYVDRKKKYWNSLHSQRVAMNLSTGARAYYDEWIDVGIEKVLLMQFKLMDGAEYRRNGMWNTLENRIHVMCTELKRICETLFNESPTWIPSWNRSAHGNFNWVIDPDYQYSDRAVFFEIFNPVGVSTLPYAKYFCNGVYPMKYSDYGNDQLMSNVQREALEYETAGLWERFQNRFDRLRYGNDQDVMSSLFSGFRFDHELMSAHVCPIPTTGVFSDSVLGNIPGIKFVKVDFVIRRRYMIGSSIGDYGSLALSDTLYGIPGSAGKVMQSNCLCMRVSLFPKTLLFKTTLGKEERIETVPVINNFVFNVSVSDMEIALHNDISQSVGRLVHQMLPLMHKFRFLENPVIFGGPFDPRFNFCEFWYWSKIMLDKKTSVKKPETKDLVRFGELSKHMANLKLQGNFDTGVYKQRVHLLAEGMMNVEFDGNIIPVEEIEPVSEYDIRMHSPRTSFGNFNQVYFSEDVEITMDETEEENDSDNEE
jgi:hypothetical protein